MIKCNLHSKSDNPTKSVIVNELIKRVYKNEVKEWKTSAARRAMVLSEFHKVAKIYIEIPQNHIGGHIGAAYFLYQIQMITRLANAADFKREDIIMDMKFLFTLTKK